MFRLLFTFLFILLCIRITAQKTFTFERQLSYQKCKYCNCKTEKKFKILSSLNSEQLLCAKERNYIEESLSDLYVLGDGGCGSNCSHLFQKVVDNPVKVTVTDCLSEKDKKRIEQENKIKKQQDERDQAILERINKENKEMFEREKQINDAQNSIEGLIKYHDLETAQKKLNDFLLLNLNSEKRDYANGKLEEINLFFKEVPEKLSKLRKYQNYFGEKSYLESILNTNTYDYAILINATKKILEDLYFTIEDALKEEKLDLAKQYLKYRHYFLYYGKINDHLSNYPEQSRFSSLADKLSLIEKQNQHLEKIKSIKSRSLSKDEFNLIGIYNNYFGKEKKLKVLLHILPSRKFIYSKFENSKLKYEYIGTWCFDDVEVIGYPNSKEKRLMFFPEIERYENGEILKFNKSDQLVRFLETKLESDYKNVMNFQFKLNDNKFSKGATLKAVNSLTKLTSIDTLLNYPKILNKSNIIAYWPFNNDLIDRSNNKIKLDNNGGQIQFGSNAIDETGFSLKIKDNILNVKEFDLKNQYFTLSFLFYTRKVAKSKLIQFGNDDNGWNIVLDNENNQLLYNEFRKGKSISFTASFDNEIKNWSRVTLVRSFKTGIVLFYLNDELILFEKKKLLKIDLNNSLTIGSGFEGKVDEIIFWNKIMSIDEVNLFDPSMNVNSNNALNEYLDRESKKKVAIESLIEQNKQIEIKWQIWTKENLSVTTFNNGDPIPEAKSKQEWFKYCKDGKPAWCYYNFDPKNGALYGKLYNKFAVDDPRNIAPKGWHVPTRDEWSSLFSIVGKNKQGLSKLKTTTGWQITSEDGNLNGTNETNFSMLPSGRLWCNGTFEGLGSETHLWSLNGSDDDYFPDNVLHEDFCIDCGISVLDKCDDNYTLFIGLPIRCIKD